MAYVKTDGALKAILELAKEGDIEATAYLMERHHLKVFTNEEIQRVNDLIDSGIEQTEAINQIDQERIAPWKS